LGETLERSRRRRKAAIIGGLFAVGFAGDAVVGFTEADDLFDMEARWPPTLAAALAFLLVIVIIVGRAALMKQTDEVELIARHKATGAAAGAYLVAYPAWFILWKGGFVPEPMHVALFVLFLATFMLLPSVIVSARVAQKEGSRMKKLLFGLALAFAPVPAFAWQDSATAEPPVASVPAPALEDADPAVWVVRDEDTTIYLFGTFHLLDARPWFNDEVRTAFDASDELVLEAIIPENPAEMQGIVLRYAVDQQGRRLSQYLTPEQIETLNRALGRLGVPPGAFDPLEPWFATLMLANAAALELGVGADNGPETILSHAARERGIPIGELEGLEWQMRMFDGLPEETQLAQLRQALDNFDQLADQLAPMLAAWSTGDVEALREIMAAQGSQDPAFHRILFTDRNNSWAGWIVERMERPGTVFLAVGAGHLAGEDSVQAVLAARGVAAERVPNEMPQ